MRSIKFRQYYAGKFHYWGFKKEDAGMSFISPIDLLTESNQFTGLTDKNGKEIYESDLVKVHLTKSDDFVAEIIWHNEKFGWRVKSIEGKGGQGLWDFSYLYNCEVIGNIYENPELLK